MPSPISSACRRDAAPGTRVWSRGLIALFGAALLAWACLPQTAAQAAEDDGARSAAKAKLEHGAKSLREGEYADALADFEQAYHLVPSAKIFFNIGLADVGLARYPEALKAFERFLAEAKTAAPANLSEARVQAENLRPKVAIVEVTAYKAGLEIVIDGRSFGKTPLTELVYLDPGEHRLLAQQEDGPPQVQTFTVTGGRKQPVAVRAPKPAMVNAAPLPGASPRKPAEARSTDPALTPEPVRPWQRPLAWGTAGGALLGAGVGVYELLQYNHNAQALNKLTCMFNGNDVQGDLTCADTANARDNARLGTIVALSAAGALAVTSAILFLTDPPETTESAGGSAHAARASVACAPSLSGAGATCLVRF